MHENFPAQFGGIARFLAQEGWQVVFATASDAIAPGGFRDGVLPGVKVVRYKRRRDAGVQTHHYLRGTERAILNGQGFARLAGILRSQGFVADVVVSHSGWGSGSFAKSIWPKARSVQYLEWWYNFPAPDLEPTDQPRAPEEEQAKALARNLPFLLDAQTADVIQVPTEFQAAQIPEWLKGRVHVIHDGVDGTTFRPQAPHEEGFQTAGLPDRARIITYATRGMEPMRGFPQFMAEWNRLQRLWPDVYCVVAGTDRVSYGRKLPKGESFKARALAEYDIDETRCHFVGHLRKADYARLLQRSAAHVYLSRPFVVSWSLIEAMMTAAPIVTSKGQNVREVAPEGTAIFADMDDIGEIVAGVSQHLSDPTAAKALGLAARRHAKEIYAADKLHPRIKDLYQSLLPAERSTEHKKTALEGG